MRTPSLRVALRVLALFAVLVPLSASVDASGQAEGSPPAEVARWRTIHTQGFEGVFPAGKWITYDSSHTSTQGIWSKGPTPFSGTYSASPRGGVTPYNYNTHTWMRFGPFSLTGATNARMLFKYWVDSEAGYDFFSFDYTCGGVDGPWTGRSVSGNVQTWTSANLSLQTCIGRPEVYVQFTFVSDQSVNYQGVRVDDVVIQKFA